MKRPSYEHQFLITQLYRKSSLWERAFNQQSELSSFLSEFEQKAEVTAVLDLIPALLISNKRRSMAVAKTVHKMVCSLSVLEIPEFDKFVRSNSIYYSVNPQWNQMKPSDVLQLASFEEFAVSILGVCSFHRNGYIRTEAVKSLARFDTGHELPFLLIRLNDWVPNVYHIAHKAIQSRIAPLYAKNFIHYFEIVLKLANWKRQNHNPLLEAIVKLIQTPESLPILMESLETENVAVKRAMYQITLGTPKVNLKKVIDSGLKERDYITRLKVAMQMSSIANKKVLSEFLPQLKANKSMAIRREALRIVMKQFPEQRLSELKNALLDKHSSIRFEAQYYITQIDNINLVSFYKDTINNGPENYLYSAISGLGEVGGKNDDSVILLYTKHHRIHIRRSAIRSLAKLNPNNHNSVFMNALQDISSSVSREATKALKLSNHYVTNEEELWLILAKNTSLPHARKNALSLLVSSTKWKQLFYILKSLTLNDEKLVQIANDYIDRWIWNYNKSYTLPTEQQTRDLLNLLSQIKHHNSKNLYILEKTLLRFTKQQGVTTTQHKNSNLVNPKYVQQTLQKIDHEIASGAYGKARDRLHGLLTTYPHDLSLRQRLGEVYWRLHHPAMAGRYWYLDEAESPERAAARAAFEQSCGHDPLQILKAVKFRGSLKMLTSEFAKNRLLTLQAEVKEKYNTIIHFERKGRTRYEYVQTEKRIPDEVIGIGCIAVAVVSLGLMLIGLMTILEMIF